MRIIAAAALTTLALAGCNKGTVNETNASVEDVANAVAEAKPAMKLQPGRWETTSELVSMDAPGMPPQAQDMMKKQMAVHNQSVAVCLKPQDVENPGGGFFGQGNKDCRFDHYRMGGGSIDAKMSCTPAGGPSVSTQMSGRYGPDHYAMDVTSTLAGPGQPMTMRMKMTSRRVGNCTGDELWNSNKAATTTAAS